MRAGGLLLFLLGLCTAGAWAGPGQFEPHIAYVFPAGGRQGSSFQVVAGGQFLRSVKDAYVSGEGVQASIAFHIRPISPQQMQLVTKRLREWFQARQGQARWRPAASAQPGAGSEKIAEDRDGVKWPDLPVLADLEKKSPDEIRRIMRLVFEAFVRQRTNPQMSECVFIDVTIAPDAPPGDRELRLGGWSGLTNPMRFEVGQLPEVREPEPVAPANRMPGAGGKRGSRMANAFDNRPEPPPPVLEPPVVLNGQVLEGEVDRFPLRARKGQRLVIRTEARALVPYVADAVPGWFQAVVALYDPKGREVAYADDFRFDPDPVLYYEIPEDGEYRLEIRDSIYRGREDFVYRVTLSEQPFITRLFPLGGRAGTATIASIAGWNLPESRLPLDTRPGLGSVRLAALPVGKGTSNRVCYEVNTLPEVSEIEPNDTGKQSHLVTLPVIINGRIARPGDVDVFRIEGRAGDEVVAEVRARRLGSPLDSLLQIYSATGQKVAMNDDTVDPEFGLLTHHADSYVRLILPKDGPYFVRLSDSQSHGDDSHAYRLHLRRPTPDFALRVTPSSVNMPGTGTAVLTAHVVRRDGFDGAVDLALTGAPEGFRLGGARIPRGRDCVRITLSAPPMRPFRTNAPLAIRLEGQAKIGGAIVVRPAVPADDLMQAFAYRHLVPRQEMLVTAGGRRGSGAELVGGPVRVPVGGTATVKIQVPAAPRLGSLSLELSDPPKGLSIGSVSVQPDGVSFVVKADAAVVKAGFADNLILEAFTDAEVGGQGDKGAKRTRRFSAGVLPAIPVEVVPR